MRLLRIGSGIAIVLAACCVQALAQSQPPRSSDKPPGKGDSIVVRGCLVGPTLESTDSETTEQTGHLSGPLTYRLKGEKKLLKKMRAELDGKLVEITGILQSNLPQDSATRGTTLGKTKVTFGVGSSATQKGAPDLQPSLPVLEVKSFDSSGARCRG